ncbi:hypothetical protein Aperf_G00000123561 [Anoplocephala perfoliata]
MSFRGLIDPSTRSHLTLEDPVSLSLVPALCLEPGYNPTSAMRLQQPLMNWKASPTLRDLDASVASVQQRARVLILYKRLMRLSKTCTSASGDAHQAAVESEYIRQETRNLFRRNANLADPKEIEAFDDCVPTYLRSYKAENGNCSYGGRSSNS